MGRTAHLLRSATGQGLERMGVDISPEKTQALMVLADANRPLSMGEFATLMMRDATTLKRQLDDAVALKLVQRQASRDDGRVVLVSLTERGRQLLDLVLPMWEGLRKRALRGISKREMETTMRTLRKMQHNLSSSEPSASP